MKKLRSDIGVEFYKGKRTKFWNGVFLGFVVGYMPYIIHMNQWLR